MGDHDNPQTDAAAEPDAAAPAALVLPPGMVTPAVNGNGAHGPPPSFASAGADPYAPGSRPKPAHPGHAPAAPEKAPEEAPAADGIAHILARQWPVLVTTTALALLLGVAYLLVAPKAYTATAKLLVSPLDPHALTGAGTGSSGDGQLPDDYLDTECVVIKSDAVLALALDQVARTRTLLAAAHPLDALKDRVDATVAKKGKAIEVSFDGRYPQDDERIVGAVVNAYRAYNADYWKTRAEAVLDPLQTGAQSRDAELAEKQQRMLEIARASGAPMEADPDKSPAHQAAVSWREAKTRADLEAIQARTAYQERAKGILGDPAGVAAVDRAAPSFSTNPQDQLKQIEAELVTQQARLTDAKQQFLPDHPVVRTIQSRIEQLTVAAVIAAKQWQDQAEGNQAAVAHKLAEAQGTELEALQLQSQYTRLEADVKHLQTISDDVDNRIHNTQLAQGTGAVVISVLDLPHADLAHARPGAAKTLAVAALLGLLGGAGLACARDFADDRFRTLAAIRTAAGAPVLGAIPAIPAAVAASAADRGQVVHFDPFGDASESYRTLRTALQFGMPARTKTLLVTSPVAGDGKSTLVSNLAIAMAQANRRVLVIDADLRAPVQHRLFGLSDRTGLASVLDGTDTLDEAIRHTGVVGLDVLPAGPIPANPAELLNTPAFNDHVNDLADRYDMVLIDSPPVTAVTDARILAASADASLLVVRLGSSTRHQTERARDGLRGVGARLIGVAVNGVSRRGNLASATGYYARPEMAPATSANPMIAAPDPTPEYLPGGRLGRDELSDDARTAPPAARR